MRIYVIQNTKNLKIYVGQTDGKIAEVFGVSKQTVINYLGGK